MVTPMINKLLNPVTFIRIKRANQIIQQISAYLDKREKVLDIGCGKCFITQQIQNMGINITPLDITNQSYFKEIKPEIYKGNKIPFKDKSFNVALLLMVLHHTKNPEIVIKEAIRVANKLIIIEDIYTTSLDKFWVTFRDSVLNMQFKKQPHSNKTDLEWQKLFNTLKLEILDCQFNKSFLFPKTDTAIYHLKIDH